MHWASQHAAKQTFPSTWPGSVYFALVEPAARAALALDPDEPRATMALSAISEMGGRWLDMEANDLRAMTLYSGDAQIELVRGQHLIALGKLRDGLKKVRAGYALAPANTTIILSLGLSCSLVGQNEEAEKVAGQAAALAGTADLGTSMTAVKSATALRQGRYSEAAQFLVSTMDQADPDWAKAAQVVNLVYAALADPTQRDKGLAARARLYPKRKFGSRITRVTLSSSRVAF